MPVRTGPAQPFQHLDVEELNGGPVTDVEVGSINQWSQHNYSAQEHHRFVSFDVCGITPLPPLIGLREFQLRGTCALGASYNSLMEAYIVQFPETRARIGDAWAASCEYVKSEGENIEEEAF